MDGSKKAVCAVLVLLALLVGGCAHQVPSDEKILASTTKGLPIGHGEIIGKFPALWIEGLTELLEQFRKMGEKPECYTVVTYSDDGVNYVLWGSLPDSVREENGVVDVPFGERTKCWTVGSIPLH